MSSGTEIDENENLNPETESVVSIPFIDDDLPHAEVEPIGPPLIDYSVLLDIAQLQGLYQEQRFSSPEPFVNRITRDKIPHLIRKGSECTQVIIDGYCFNFTSVKNFPRAKLFLFNNVKRDVNKWLKDRTDIFLPPAVATSTYNINYDVNDGQIIGIDLNHAYWRIAFVKGIISEKTYNHGLINENDIPEGKVKALRLATLSVLGRQKSFKQYFEGREIGEVITQAECPLRRKVYKYIRTVCFDMMRTLSIRLGNDFESWKVDCIYFRDTPETQKLVMDFFDRRNMTYKILDYYEE